MTSLSIGFNKAIRQQRIPFLLLPDYFSKATSDNPGKYGIKQSKQQQVQKSKFTTFAMLAIMLAFFMTKPVKAQNTNSGNRATNTQVQAVASVTANCLGSDRNKPATINSSPMAPNAAPEPPTPVTALPSTICFGSSSVLNATSTGNTINWYTVASGGTKIGSSASAADYTVTPNTTTTYYAEAESPSVSGGSQTFNYTGSIVNFTVPAGITSLTLNVKGAQGGGVNSNIGGRGANVIGDVSVTPGQILKILVGQNGVSTSNFAPGGGGSFVTTAANAPLMIAGGGSGATLSLNGSHGQITTYGAPSSNGVAGGTDGNGGSGGVAGGGGGGLLTDGGNGITYNINPGKAFINGGAGAIATGGASYNGGFGGGGASEGNSFGMAGAGGGYSGGGGGTPVSGQGTGGGGGSYNGGTNQTNITGSQTGNGQVVISWAAVSGSTSATRTPVTVAVLPETAIPTAVTAEPAIICSGSESLLNATSTGNTINWYTVASGGTKIGSSLSGAEYAVDPIATTTYYAEAASPSVSAGSQTFNYTGSIVNFTVPAGITSLTLNVKGAQGGGVNSNIGGRGANVIGDVSVTPGQILKILVGQNGVSTSNFAPGGGGSFVTTAANAPLMIAGGGSGATLSLNGSPGQITTYGAPSSNGVAGGTGGNGGSGGVAGGGGGGLLTDGGNGINYNTNPGKAFINGGAGAIATGGASYNGGFGGGGASEGNSFGMGGAGGGYSGGGGGTPATGQGTGGGGGSYNGGTNQTNIADSQYGNGQVVISWGAVTGCTSLSRTPVTVTINTNYTWLGTTDKDWNTPENWSCNIVPTANDNVVIPDVANDPTIFPTVEASCNNLTVNSSATLTIESGGSLVHNSNGVQATVKRIITGSTNLTQYKYHFVSIPTLYDPPLSNLFLGSYLYDLDPTKQINPPTNPDYGKWIGLDIPTNTTLVSNKGYMVYYPGASKEYTFTGELYNGAFAYSLIGHSGTGVYTFNLIPNPYPSAMIWNTADGAAWNKTASVGGTCYIWNAVAGNYTNLASSATSYIPAGQAMMVVVLNDATPSLSIKNNTVRTHSSQSFYKSGGIENQLIVKATANDYADETVVKFTEEATEDFDLQIDGLKINGLEDAPQLYTLSADKKLSINNLPAFQDQRVVAMNFETQFTGQVTLNFSEIGSFDPSLSIYLKDELTNQTINIRNQQVYTFMHNPGNAANRFKLVFGGTIGIDETPADANKMWIAGNTLYINTTELVGKQAMIEVYNPAGQRLLSKSTILNELTTMDLNLKGFVIVKLTSGQKVLTTKGIIMK